MSKIIEIKGNRELRKLDESWSPWTWQVLTFSDGEHYGSGKGNRICTGQLNSESEEQARKYF